MPILDKSDKLTGDVIVNVRDRSSGDVGFELVLPFEVQKTSICICNATIFSYKGNCRNGTNLPFSAIDQNSLPGHQEQFMGTFDCTYFKQLMVELGRFCN